MFGSRFYIFMGGLIVAATALLASSTIGCNELVSAGIVAGDKPTVASRVPSASQPAWDMFMASCLSPSARGYDERRIANSCAYIADLAVVERRARLATTRIDLNDEEPGSGATDE